MKVTIDLACGYSYCENCPHIELAGGYVRCRLFSAYMMKARDGELFRLPQCIRAEVIEPKPQTKLYARYMHCLGGNCPEYGNGCDGNQPNEGCLYAEVREYDPETDALGAYETVEEYDARVACRG